VLFGVSHIRVPTLTTTMADIIDCTNDIDLRDNVIVMEVDNLLVGWPAYEIVISQILDLLYSRIMD
jgi:hypothetical protein